MRLLNVVLVSILAIVNLQAQITQVIKGTVRDKDSQTPLTGATVIIENTNPVIGTTTDYDGNFKLVGVPIGRQSIKISFIGYEPFVVHEIMVSSGKEVVLNIELKESTVSINEVTVRAYSNKEQPLNPMASISARQINMEEANRYAGGFDDPARLAASMAGVSGSLANNAIVVRGNSPKGILWRMEGVEISTPSHFANITTFGGGGITALSSQMLANSDFFTGAFPAEYGNALSGVFDLKLRNGNNDKKEFTFQAGIIGLDFSAEGPLKQGGKSSFLFNYRYSTFSLIEPLLPEDAGGIRYQDLCFKFNLPTKKTGTFSVWGIGAADKNPYYAEKDSANWVYTQDMQDGNYDLYMGGVGINHKMSISNRSYMHTSVALSGNGIIHKQSQYNSQMELLPNEKFDYFNWRYTFSSFLNYKFSSKVTSRTGFEVTDLFYNIQINHAAVPGGIMDTVTNEKSSGMLLKFFTQTKYELTPSISLNGGVYAQYFQINNRYSLEPRLSASFKLAPKHKLTFAYGLHSQLEMLQIYMVRSKNGTGYPNKNLNFTKSHHFIAGYDWLVNDNLRIKIEPYFQKLVNVPVIKNSFFSMINMDKDWYFSDSLENNGTGTNKGVDFTLEHFLYKGYYYLFTLSLLDSKYKGGDGITHNTRFNRGYVCNLLGGKEWALRNRNIFSVNGRINFMGGERISPLNYNVSIVSKEAVYNESRAFEKSKPDVWYVDLTVNYKINKRKHSSTWSLKLVNLLGTKEFYGYRYNHKTQQMETEEEAIIIPNLSYKIEF